MNNAFIARAIGITPQYFSNIYSIHRIAPWKLSTRLAQATGSRPESWATPNKVIMEDAVDRTIRACKLAAFVGLPKSRIQELIGTGHPPTDEEAAQLAEASGTSPDLWATNPLVIALKKTEDIKADIEGYFHAAPRNIFKPVNKG